MERSFGVNTPRKVNTTVPSLHLLKMHFLKNKEGLKTGKLNLKSWTSNSEIVLMRTSLLAVPSGSLLGFLGIILVHGDLSGACQYQRRVCPSPRYSKNSWKRGFKNVWMADKELSQ